MGNYLQKEPTQKEFVDITAKENKCIHYHMLYSRCLSRCYIPNQYDVQTHNNAQAHCESIKNEYWKCFKTLYPEN